MPVGQLKPLPPLPETGVHTQTKFHKSETTVSLQMELAHLKKRVANINIMQVHNHKQFLQSEPDFSFLKKNDQVQDFSSTL